MSQCKAETAAGERCKNNAKDDGYCYIPSHSDVKDCEKLEEKKQKPYQDNHRLIVSKYIELLKLKKESPTLQEVADATGFHINTIWKHVNDMNLNDHVEISGTRALTQDVLLGIANAARKGSSANAKLYFEIVHGWMPKQSVDFRDITPEEFDPENGNPEDYVKDRLSQGKG